MKRLILLILLLFLLSGCQAPAADLPRTEPPPVVVMSSPEGTAEPGPAAEPVSDTEPPSPQPVPTPPVEETTVPAAQAPEPEAPKPEFPEPEAPEGLYLQVNGARLAPGMPYAAVQAALGPQTAPDQALTDCDGSFFGTVHFYPGMTVTENEMGLIRGIELSVQFEGASGAALLGRVGLGTTMEAAVAALGEPENAGTAEEDRVLTYGEDGWDLLICFFDPEDPKAVSGISMTLSAE